jgi:hypothetical protein
MINIRECLLLIAIAILNTPINFGVGVGQDDSAALLAESLLWHLEIPIPLWMADYAFHLGHLLGVW